MAKVIKSYKQISHNEMYSKTVELFNSSIDSGYFTQLGKSVLLSVVGVLISKDIMKDNQQGQYIYT